MAVNKPDPEVILEAAHRCSVIGEEVQRTMVMYAVGRGVPPEVAQAYVDRTHPPMANLIHGACMAATHHMLTMLDQQENPPPSPLKSN